MHKLKCPVPLLSCCGHVTAGDPTDGADYVAVGVTGGHVIFQYNLGSGNCILHLTVILDFVIIFMLIHNFIIV